MKFLYPEQLWTNVHDLEKHIFLLYKNSMNGNSLAGLGVSAVFVFWVIFPKIFKHQVQGICGQVHWLKKPMLAYGKNMSRNNQFSVFLPRKSKIWPKIKICPISLKI